MGDYGSEFDEVVGEEEAEMRETPKNKFKSEDITQAGQRLPSSSARSAFLGDGSSDEGDEGGGTRSILFRPLRPSPTRPLTFRGEDVNMRSLGKEASLRRNKASMVDTGKAAVQGIRGFPYYMYIILLYVSLLLL